MATVILKHCLPDDVHPIILSFLSPLEVHADVPLKLLTTKYGDSVSNWTLGLTYSYTNESTGITFIRVQGKRHCVDRPAVVRPDGEKQWYLNDMLNRHGGPAIEKANGDKEWYCNGVLHRSNGPAVENADGDMEWHVNGNLHRTDGPAIYRRLIDANQYPTNFGWETFWYNHGILHRSDEPAVERWNGDKEWWLNGQCHRNKKIGPAIIRANGKREWYVYGKFLCKSDGVGFDYSFGF